MPQSPTAAPTDRTTSQGPAPAPAVLGDPYALLHATLKRLSEHPQDASAALLASRAYVALGLFGPARELLSGPLADSSPASALRQQLRHAPSGRVSWESLRHRFEANVRALYAAHTELAEYDSVFRELPRVLVLYQSNDGNVHASQRSVHGLRGWVPDIRDFKKLVAATALPHDPTALFCGSYLIGGDRLNAFFERVYQFTDRMFLSFSPRIYVLDPDVQRFALALWVCPSVEHLCHDRASLFIGPRCFQDLAAFLRARPALGLPAHMICVPGLSPSDGAALRTTLQTVSDEREQRGRTLLDAVCRHHRALPLDHWRRRFAEGSRLRVLGMTSRFTTFLQHSMRDWRAAFERLGHEFHLLIEPNDHDLYTPLRFAEVIDEYRPDLVVVIDHLRAEYPRVVPPNLPFVCWIQDDLGHLTHREAGRSVGPMDFVCGFSKWTYVGDYEYPADRFLSCVIPTDPTVYDATPVPATDLSKHRCDVSATTHASKTPEQMRDEYAARLRDPAARKLLWAIYDEVRQRVGQAQFLSFAHIRQLVDQCERQTGVTLPDPQVRYAVFCDFASRVHDRSLRHATLEWVARWAERTGRTFALYGNGWERHPVLGKFARGPAANGYELRCVYQASTIGLHVSGFGSLHQRLLDGLCSGGFFLVRYNPADFVAEAAAGFADLLRDRSPQPESSDALGSDARWHRCVAVFRDAGLGVPYPDHARPGSDGFQELLRMADTADSASRWVPRLAEITFDSEQTFVERVEHFVAHPDERRAIAAAMREIVLHRFTYEGFTASLLAFIRQRLGATGLVPDAPAPKP